MTPEFIVTACISILFGLCAFGLAFAYLFDFLGVFPFFWRLTKTGTIFGWRVVRFLMALSVLAWMVLRSVREVHMIFLQESKCMEVCGGYFK